MRYTTPLRYPGGKAKLTEFVKMVVRENGLLDGHYVEPFAGGAGVALGLLFQQYVIHAHINDLNRSVYCFWRSVLEETEALCRLIHDTPVTMEQWYLQRDIQKDPDADPLELGFSTFFLNRTNRSGIIDGGVIGGKEQTGNWKIDARFNKEALIARVRAVAHFRSRISIYNLDASEFLVNVVPALPERTLVYLDPPYYVKGKDLYENHFRHEDHQSLAGVVQREISQRWMVSYDFVPEIAEMYEGYRQIDYLLSYSAAEKYKGSELMIFDNDLIIPDVSNPARAKEEGRIRRG